MRARKKPNLIPRLEICKPLIINDPLACKGLLRERFANPQAPLHLEIGCGKGKFIRELAARHPDINFIAMEREKNVAVMAIEQAMVDGLQNVLFILDDAEKLPEMFLPGEITRIYINFCDPWHKSRQYKRRLTWRGRLDAYKALLKDGGELWFKTDNEPLYRFSLEEFAASFPAYFTTEDLHYSEVSSDNIMTEYETKFSELGQNIFAIRAKK